MPTRSWCCRQGASSSAAGTRPCWRRAASTPPCGRASRRKRANPPLPGRPIPPSSCLLRYRSRRSRREAIMGGDSDRSLMELAAGVEARDRRALARAITLVESNRPADRSAADRLIEKLLPATGHALRLGISGSPGVGKSTFIEAFGLHLVEARHRLAVLAIDPSSRVSGGSIL